MYKVLIAVDGSEAARRAILAAAALAKQVPGLQAILVHARDWPMLYGDLPPLEYEALDRAQAKAQATLLEAALGAARQAGLSDCAVEPASGQPAAEIVRIARERDVDQIVMGTHGRGAFGNLILGSVAQRVVHLAAVPVLLVK